MMWAETIRSYIRLITTYNRTWPRVVLAATFLLFAISPISINAYEAVPSPSELKKLSVEELMNLEVTSVSKRPEKLTEAPSAIQVITGEEIRRSGATSIPEALRLATNLHVAQKGSHDWGITARGFNTNLANKLLVLIDGRTVYTPLYSGVFWERQDYLLEDIDRIEVISGPGGTLWGANAVNGVINIITKSADETQGLYVEGGGGSELKKFTSARFGGQLDSNSYCRVYGKYFDRDGAVYADGSDAHDAWQTGQGGFRLDATTASEIDVTLQGDYYNSEQDLLAGGTAHVIGGNVLGRGTVTFSENSDMSFQLYYDRTHLNLPTQAIIINSIQFAPAGRLKDDLDTYDVDFQHRFHLGSSHRVVWGLGYRFTHDVLKNSPGLAFFPRVLDQSLYSGFVQNEVKILENLFLTLGTKLEHNDYTGWEVEPSGRLQWNVTSRHMLWGAISRAVRTPSRIDRDVSQPAPPYLVVLAGGRDFTSETVIASELGYRTQLGSQLVTSVSGFYNDYDDIRSTSTTPTTILPFFFENNLDGETYGFELTTNYQVMSWAQLQGGYTLLQSDIRIKPGKTDLNAALNETADPEQQFALHSSMDLSKSMDVDARLRWVDILYNNNAAVEGTVPSYFELDIRLGWHLTNNFEFSIVGQNLLDNQHPEYGFPGPSREEIERSVYGKVACRF